MAEEKPWWQQVGDAVGGAVDDARKAVGNAADQAKKAAGEAVDAARNTGAGKAIEDAVGEGQNQVDKARKGVENTVKEGTTRARAAGSAAVAAITGEEPPRPLVKAEIIEIQKALSIGADGGVGKGTRAAVTTFAEQNGLDPATIITPDGKGIIGTSEFLGAIEAKRGVDLAFFKPTPDVQERITEGLNAASDKIKEVGAGALGWMEEQARKLCAATGNVNPDGSCKAPEATPGNGRQGGGMERQN